jgi:hypothetical protein
MDINASDTAVVIIDPQNDVLSEKGVYELDILPMLFCLRMKL